MKFYSPLILIIIYSCNFQPKNEDLNPLTAIETISYLEINKEVQNILQKNNGIFPMILFNKTKGRKHLIYFGEQHGNDPSDKRFDTIQKYFELYRPAVLLNEGGQISDSIHFVSREESIKKNGTIGFLKFLADKTKIQLKNADCPDSAEVFGLLKKYNRNKILYILVIQRFIPQFLSEYGGSKDLKAEYETFITKYLITRCKFKLTQNEKSWSHFEKLYTEINNGKNIDLNNFDLSQTEYYLYDKGELGDIGRSSLHIRDSVIIKKIYENLQNHNKVFIVFGAAHLLAQKPTLERMFE